MSQWLVPSAIIGSFALAMVVAFVGKRVTWLAPVLASLAPVSVLSVGVAALSHVEGAQAGEPWRSALATQGAIPWFTIGRTTFEIGWAVDSLAAVMLVVVGVVATCVVVFSAGYMKGDPGWARYFALLALFSGSMTLLVVGDGFVPLFVGWELVGACSYLLVGFWFAKPSAAAAATKAFMTTRVGDVGLLLGLGALWAATGSLRFAEVAERLPEVAPVVVATAAVLIAIGAMGKSAQFPLHAWLPDAMEGPTPVSALIHAATMVAAGVYLVARMWPLFEAAPAARAVLLAAGTISALGAAFVAVAQRDIKKVLAYSTVSQLGLMFAALGVGAWEAAFFHLVTHAAFKALLFLASGSVIHGASTQDLHEMGGLRKAMPWTFATWVVGSLALAGIAPFAGFFSKDAVLESVLMHSPVAGVALFAASTLTAYYMMRATRLAFFGRPAVGLHAHESPWSMVVPLLVLAVPAVGLGFFGARVSELLHAEHEPLALAISAAAVGLALAGGAVGWFASAGVAGDGRTRERLGRAWDVLAAAYHWDAFVTRFVVQPTVTASRALWAVGDRLLADGAAEGLARVSAALGRLISRLQSGDAQNYAAVMVVAAMLMLLATAWLGR
jgi:NADH-quinone oxidoreductase subunit L